MTILHTLRQDFSDAAQVYGWRRESFGVGYRTDLYSRGTDTVQVTFGESNSVVMDASVNRESVPAADALAVMRSDKIGDDK